ncbi:phosphatidylinositol mannoside acyltransferase, partial [Streptomyces albiflaviniger]|nr:phosphatidylinositol mannoside acyltransferase [Streptomyces albiflaviniger]
HPPVETPGDGNRAERIAVMTQEVADAFASGISEHPEDWHMLQRLWLADLDRGPGGAGSPEGPGGPGRPEMEKP